MEQPRARARFVLSHVSSHTSVWSTSVCAESDSEVIFWLLVPVAELTLCLLDLASSAAMTAAVVHVAGGREKPSLRGRVAIRRAPLGQ